ncbi:hypothetical protein EZV62_002066 [Acer yangbiense]|uniref:Uncharacterized protein n=1 Tax=Acer yangbiense TaxID=1000413 RepID=A0A5C7IW02_9ROSI|nr:hypothetical protein EZV62_002066 [Acer yangbiense]
MFLTKELMAGVAEATVGNVTGTSPTHTEFTAKAPTVGFAFGVSIGTLEFTLEVRDEDMVQPTSQERKKKKKKKNCSTNGLKTYIQGQTGRLPKTCMQAGDSAPEELATATQVKGPHIPITLELVKPSQEMKSFKAYDKLRVERTNERHVGARLKRVAEAEKEEKK